MRPKASNLPDSLTRLLATPQRRAPGRARGEHPLPGTGRDSPHAALEAALLRGFVYGVSGLVWLVVAALFVRHLAR
ncbi:MULTISPECIES: hypothetical protein [Methylobacterium]|uniref:Uncharacterized protein n=1 Tax=Methylobacterium longum TaxID=767694 RepID=A0ABT8ANS0_9HYPH|nr:MULTISPECIES: hypothetical protein [Methylobacterium]MCJ2098104.1 hypothetical protein [Methylobacterium sp. E-046]MDN3571538.1 hypothetical protein [Methylobacterium longum]GJE12482.1 hypothetical protein FOHLNKBM_3532 [Methylobacterium longum]